MGENKRLGELLIDAGLITEAELNKALRLQVGGNRRLGYILIKMGIISEEQLHSILSRQMDLPMADISRDFDPAVKKILPKYLCRRYSVLPMSTEENNTLVIAMVDPSDTEAVSDIEKYTGKILRPVLASKSEISSSIGSRIPWTTRDVFNSQTSTVLTAVIAGIALLLIIIIAILFYQDRQREKYGTTTTSPQLTTYENNELILGFDKEGQVSLFGHGAYSSGFYSVTFDDTGALRKFLEAKKEDLSAKQVEWLEWAMENPAGHDR